MIRRSQAFVAAYVSVLCIISMLWMLWTPYSGDDFAYMGGFSGANVRFDSWWELPRWLWGHWITTNGRLGSYLAAPVLTLLPHWLLAVVCAAMQWIMMWFTVAVSRTGHRPVVASILVSVEALALPWWDSLQVFDCQLNYVWPIALVLVAFWRLLISAQPCRGLGLVWWCVFFGAAGMMHEACSLPVCVGLAVYFIVGKWRPAHWQWWLSAAFIAGTALAVFSPGIMGRASQSVEPDDTYMAIMLVSDFMVLVMIVVLVSMTFFSVGRSIIRQKLSSPIIVLATAAVVSGVISVASGVIGRSGWFAQVYALIVLGWAWLQCYRRSHIATACAMVLAIAAAIHYAFVLSWQIRLGREYDSFLARYIEMTERHPDGVVYTDFTHDDEIPLPVLNRVRGVPDADDAYQLSTFSGYYSPDSIWPIILPEEAAGVHPSAGETVALSSGDFICGSAPRGMRVYASSREGVPVYLLDRGGRQWVVQPYPAAGDTLYHLTRRIIDPGDR